MGVKSLLFVFQGNKPNSLVLSSFRIGKVLVIHCVRADKQEANDWRAVVLFGWTEIYTCVF